MIDDFSIFITRQHTAADTLVLYENGLKYRHSFFHHTVAQSF